MTRRSLLGALGAALPAPLVSPSAAPLAAAAPPSAPVRDTWRDAARGRDVPVLLRLPAAPGPRPVVILSHGLGGSREGLGYLGRALAEAGCVALHLQHAGSDEAIWRGAGEHGLALAAAALGVANAAARLLDGVFAVGEVLRRNATAGDPLAGRVDPARLAVAGHSYGAWTVQHLLGQRLPGNERGLPLPDRRLRAGIALSPVPPRGMPARVAFARIEAPILHLTGTEDRSAVDNTQPEDREIPFRATEGAPAALVVLAGATHASFADEGAAGPRWADPTYHPRIVALSLLFLRAMLDGEAPARDALRAGAPGVLARADRIETKGI